MSESLEGWGKDWVKEGGRKEGKSESKGMDGEKERGMG